MKEIFKKLNTQSIIETTVYRAGIYLMWFCFALSVVVFIKGDITKGKLVTLLFVVGIIHAIRTGFKYFYKKIANKNYHDIKHTVELNIFEKTKSIKSSNLEKIDKEVDDKVISLAHLKAAAMYIYSTSIIGERLDSIYKIKDYKECICKDIDLKV